MNDKLSELNYQLSRSKFNDKQREQKEKTVKDLEKKIKQLKLDAKKIPMKRTHKPGRFLVGKENVVTPATEDEIRKAFGNRFVDELMASEGRFVNVPVGDFRKSTLEKHPELILPGAPLMEYRQSEDQQLCAFKSLASVLHYLGWKEEAKKLNAIGEKEGMSTVDGWKRLWHACKDILPRWVEISRMPDNFSWINDLKKDMILCAVLHTSDGHKSHAVTFHGGFIFDSNESIAIPLRHMSLNYCSSNNDRKATFLGFHKGILFQYKGTKSSKKLVMNGPKTNTSSTLFGFIG